MTFQNVRVLIWDFDGTLYRPNVDLFHKVREAEFQTIMDHTHWSREKTIEEFGKYYKTITPSATQTVAALSKISIAQAAIESEKYFDRVAYLHRDPRLVELFTKLKGFRHYILANGVSAMLKKVLPVLGIPVSTFKEIVTSEIVGVTKPDPKGFLYIMNKTGLPPAAHLMIGDREMVDIAPAKALGMHTCLVWSGTKSTIADVTLPTVYDVSRMIV